jgi:type VI secretion system protein VasJ
MDWEKVIRLSSEILAQKSKDLLVASYLSVGLIYTRKTEGWATGIRIYRDLLEHFWEGLYPSKNRMRGRIGALEWWVEKTVAALEQSKPSPLPPEELTALKESVEKIETLLEEYLEETPAFGSLHDVLQALTELSQEAPKPEVPPPPKKEESAPGAPPKVQEPRKEEVGEKISSPQEAQRTLLFGLQKIRETAAYFWQESLSNPKAYRWARTAAWSSVDHLPPATNGQTRIPPPPPQVKALLSDLKNRGNSEALLRSAEERFSQFIFWIDLNRLVSEALASLGEGYQQAQEAVCQETAYFVHRLQGVENLAFVDGTPFADGDTKQWLKEVGFRAGTAAADSHPQPASASPGTEEDLMGKEVEEVQGLIKKGKLLEGVDRLQRNMRNASSRRERLLWRLALSQLLLNQKQSKLILPHLDEMVRDVETHRLEEFDPALALKVLKAAWLGWSSQADQASKEKAGHLLDRIARLDLGEVIRLGKT